MKQKPKKQRRRFVKWVVLLIVLLPGSVLAFFGSEDAVLTAILTELRAHSMTLASLFDGIDFLDQQISNMRDRIDDPVDLDAFGLVERDARMEELIPSTEALYTYPFIHGLSSYQDILNTVEQVWGRNLDNDYGDVLKFKDYIPTYTLGQTALIAEEARDFARTGENILSDLNETTEGKATVRSAQADALQVQQLAQIESNQALQISLQSQQVLTENQLEKGVHEVSGEYLKMLRNNYERLTEE
jgi:hypothetical protein